MNARFRPSAADELRARALQQAECWNSNADNLRTNMPLLEWRDNCRDEIRDQLSDVKLPAGEADKRLAAWSETFDNATQKRKVLINGFEPISAADIEDAIEIAIPQINAMGAIFRAIARISEDRDVKVLCKHGAQQAAEVENDIDVLRGRAATAGVAGGAI